MFMSVHKEAHLRTCIAEGGVLAGSCGRGGGSLNE
jgi:hypothetical protein